MTLVRFNHPALLRGLANEALTRNLMDSNLDKGINHTCKSDVLYRLNEQDDSITIEMVVPGFSKEDILIELDNEVLTIKSVQGSDENAKRSFAAVDFEKRFKVSDKIKSDAISATAENGILYVNLPKTEEAVKKPARSIEIA
jgi:HSP20 family protein